MTSGDLIRTFTAVFLPDDIRDEVSRFMAPLRRERDVKWVAPERLHLTLRFFGDLSPDEVRRVAEVTAAVAGTLPSLRLRLGGTGTFPPRGRPRVFWIGFERGGEDLVRLAETLDRGYREAGLGAADRPLTPHLTIGRARAMRGRGGPVPPSLARFGGLTIRTPDFIVSAVHVVRSDLAPQGPTYTPLAESALTGEG